MAGLNLSITLASPVLVGEPRRGNVYQSYSMIPGSVLRGAVANVLMQTWPAEQRAEPHPEKCPDRATCELCRVFYPLEGEPPRFYDCYPALSGDTSVLPFPATARTCKRHGGFIRAEDPDPKHGIFDTLIAQVAARDAAQNGSTAPYPYRPTCLFCDEDLVPPSPAYYGCREGDYYSAQPINRRFSRTAINRRRQTAQEAMLFTLSVMGEQMNTGLLDPAPTRSVTYLHGFVTPGDADLQLLREALSGLTALGSGRSRGLGRVAELRITEAESLAALAVDAIQEQLESGHFEPDGSGMISRIAAFNQALAAERSFYASFDVQVLPGRWYFTIDLLSETFVRDGGWATLKLRPEMLELPSGVLDFSFVEPLERGGWSNAWGLPRPRKIGIAPGGGFLFSVSDVSLETVQPLLRRLAELERDGIGDDRVRGAGRLLICAPFHKEVNPR